MADSHHETRAVQRKKMSASDASKDPYVFDQLITKSAESETLDTFDSASYSRYSLDELASHLSPEFTLEKFKEYFPKEVNLGSGQKIPSQTEERLAGFCVECCSSTPAEVKIDTEVPLLRDLPPLCCTTAQRPDVAVYQGKNLCVTVELHSSPFTATLRKTIVGAIDVIRLCRNADSSFSTFTAFTFPKCHIKKTVVAVTVTFKSLKFIYSLRSVAMENVKNELQRVLNTNCAAMPCEVDGRYLVKLSPKDLILFPHGSRQLPSWHALLVECEREKRCYKLCSQLAVEAHLWQFMQFSQPMKYCVQYTGDLRSGIRMVTYNRITYDPLSRAEATLCLSDLLPKIKIAMDELHSQHFAHNDVRLPNICFSDAYDPVFIDLDMSLHSAAAVRDLASCMYIKPPKANVWNAEISDLVQLGWLAAYICDSSISDYHAMSFEKLSWECQSDSFLFDLLQKGVYSDDKLSESIICKRNGKTLQAVIEER